MVLDPISKLERLDWMVAGEGLRLGKEKRKKEARPHSTPQPRAQADSISPRGLGGGVSAEGAPQRGGGGGSQSRNRFYISWGSVWGRPQCLEGRPQ